MIHCERLQRLGFNQHWVARTRTLPLCAERLGSRCRAGTVPNKTAFGKRRPNEAARAWPCAMHWRDLFLDLAPHTLCPSTVASKHRSLPKARRSEERRVGKGGR